MRHRFSMPAAAMFLGGLAASATASADGPVTIGDRVRVTAPSVSARPIHGAVGRVGEDMLIVVSQRDGRRIEVPRSRIVRLEVARGTRPCFARCALLGVGAGVALGVLLSNPPSSATQFSIDGGALASSIAVGAALGTLAGLVWRTDKWTTVPGNELALTIGPSSGRGVAVAMKVAF
jgi:hypothetical protein